MKNLVLSILGLSLVGLSQAGESVASPKATATMQATCSIEVSSIGFGVVATPLMMQSSQSEMSLRCSNASAYTIELAYGGVYGTGTYSDYSMNYDGGNTNANYYIIYNNSGTNVGRLSCGFTGTFAGKVSFSTFALAKLYGSSVVDQWTSNSGINACVSNGASYGTYPKGWTGSYNASGSQPMGGSTGYSYGVMNGSFKGDKLAYSIAVPGEPTKVWNVGTNSYKNTGNGDFQVIPVIAKIVPEKSGSKYPAPDMYLDTVTAVINY